MHLPSVFLGIIMMARPNQLLYFQKNYLVAVHLALTSNKRLRHLKRYGFRDNKKI